MEDSIHVEFFQNNSSILIKHLHILYFLCGAICFENFIRYKYRLFLLGYLCVGYFCAIIPQFKIFIQDSKLQHIFKASGFATFVSYSALVIGTIYWKRDQFHRLFDLIEKNIDRPLVTIDSKNEEGEYMKETMIFGIHYKSYFYFVLFYPLISLGKFIQFLFNYDGKTPFQVNPESDFVVPFLCDFSFDTLASYILVYYVSFVLLLPLAIFYSGALFLILVVEMHLKNNAIGLQNEIRYVSKAATETLENFNQEEERELEKNYPNAFKMKYISQQREKHIQEYMSKVRKWIKMHQDLITFMKHYTECAENVLELYIANSWQSIISLGYVMSRMLLDDENVMFEYLIYIMVTLIGLIICCSIGNVLKDVSEMVSNAVYSIPWFHLSTEDQKIILNFLTLSQQTQELRVFGVYSLSLELVPGILNDAYGYIQIMRLLVMRNRN